MQQAEIQVRGIHGGVLITLPALPWYQQRDLLIGRIQMQERFFKGGRIALDVGSTEWNEEQLLKLLKALSDEGVCLWTVLSTSEMTREAAEYHGFPTSLPDPNKKAADPQEADDQVSGFVCLSRSLEDDEHYQCDGNLLLVGDVPSRARLEVKGSLVLWGTLFGLIEIDTSDPDRFVRVLKIDKGRVMFAGLEVEVSPKLRKHNGLVIIHGADGVEVSSLKPGRLI